MELLGVQPAGAPSERVHAGQRCSREAWQAAPPLRLASGCSGRGLVCGALGLQGPPAGRSLHARCRGALTLVVVVLVAALPSASNVSLLAEKFGANNGRIARIILVTTAAAFFTFSGAVALLHP